MRRFCLAFAFALCAASSLSAQCDELVLPWTVGAGALQGSSVDISLDSGPSGSVIVSGAPGMTLPGLGAYGGVTVSREQAGVWTSTLLPPSPSLIDEARFGHAVAIDADGDTIVVGAPLHDAGTLTDSGFVAIYEWNLSTQSFEFETELIGLFDLGGFGSSVAISGEVIAVGEPLGAFGPGTVNVFRRTAPGTWVNEAFLTGSAAFEGFGWAVGISDDQLLVGTPFATASLEYGRVDFFERVLGTWVPGLSFSGFPDRFHMGFAVAIDGSQAVAGAPAAEIQGSGPEGGYAQFFTRLEGGWTQSGGFFLGEQGWESGLAVDVSGELAMVGSPGAGGVFELGVADDTGTVDFLRYYAQFEVWGAIGSVDFAGAVWEPVSNAEYTATDAAPGDRFGSAVALSGSRVVSGAPFHDGAGNDAGAAYLHDLSVFSTFVDHGQALDGALGTPVLEVSGVACSQTLLDVRATNMLPNSVLYAVLGFAQLDLPFRGGVLVPNPDKIVGPISTTGVGENALLFVWPPGLPSFSAWVQFWIVDPAGPLQASATNAIEIQVVGS